SGLWNRRLRVRAPLATPPFLLDKAAQACGSSGSVALMTGDVAKTRAALQEAGASFREMEATMASISGGPGSLAKVVRRLADAGVNIEAVMPTGMDDNEVSVAFITGDPAKARTILTAAGSTSA
ncbi:MAG: hypothetical protein ABJC39_07560, partial [Chloroflexota bacterium]